MIPDWLGSVLGALGNAKLADILRAHVDLITTERDVALRKATDLQAENEILRAENAALTAKIAALDANHAQLQVQREQSRQQRADLANPAAAFAFTKEPPQPIPLRPV